MKSSIKILTPLLVLTLIFSLAPSISYAKTAQEKAREHQEETARIRKEGWQCFKAFGHLIASGFIKNEGEVTAPENCWLPFGISKKLTNSSTTTPIDTQKPKISDLNLSVSTSSISASWLTNEETATRLYFSTSTPVKKNASSTNFVEDLVFKKTHTLSLNHLQATTTYYLLLEVWDKSNNIKTYPTISTTTKAVIN